MELLYICHNINKVEAITQQQTFSSIANKSKKDLFNNGNIAVFNNKVATTIFI